MSTDHDTYKRALRDAAAALDALADRAYTYAHSLRIQDTGYEAYNAAAHRTAVDRHNGITAALLEVYGLLEQHDRERKVGAA